MTSRPQSQCNVCAHRGQPLADGTQVCTAYPRGIPLDIQHNRADHRQPQPGDHGVRWRGAQGMPYPEWALAANLPKTPGE